MNTLLKIRQNLKLNALDRRVNFCLKIQLACFIGVASLVGVNDCIASGGTSTYHKSHQHNHGNYRKNHKRRHHSRNRHKGGRGNKCTNEIATCDNETQNKLLEAMIGRVPSTDWRLSMSASYYGDESGLRYNHHRTASGDCYEMQEPTFAVPSPKAVGLDPDLVAKREKMGSVTFFCTEDNNCQFGVATDTGAMPKKRAYDLSKSLMTTLSPGAETTLTKSLRAAPLIDGPSLLKGPSRMHIQQIIQCVRQLNANLEILDQVNSMLNNSSPVRNISSVVSKK